LPAFFSPFFPTGALGGMLLSILYEDNRVSVKVFYLYEFLLELVKSGSKFSFRDWLKYQEVKDIDITYLNESMFYVSLGYTYISYWLISILIVLLCPIYSIQFRE
jgi:hypothetical protein